MLIRTKKVRKNRFCVLFLLITETLNPKVWPWLSLFTLLDLHFPISHGYLYFLCYSESLLRKWKWKSILNTKYAENPFVSLKFYLLKYVKCLLSVNFQIISSSTFICSNGWYRCLENNEDDHIYIYSIHVILLYLSGLST